jgi:hypothetical protein
MQIMTTAPPAKNMHATGKKGWWLLFKRVAVLMKISAPLYPNILYLDANPPKIHKLSGHNLHKN